MISSVNRLVNFLAQLVKTAELSPNKNYILGCHPHGIMSAGAFTCFSTESCGFTDTFPGIRCTLAILAGLFRVPLFREYIMGAGIYNMLIYWHQPYLTLPVPFLRKYSFSQTKLLLLSYFVWSGLCPVSKPSLVHLLSKSGKGNAVVIVIGGAAESLSSSPGANTVVVKHRKGFVRMALEFGWECSLKIKKKHR